MPRKKVDKETQQLIQTGEAIKNLVESSAWQEVRKRLIRDVSAIRDITSLTQLNNEKMLFQEVAARQIAAEILLNWLKGIEGDAEQFRSNAQMLQDTYEDNIVMRFQESE